MLLLFDIDGTLAPSGDLIQQTMIDVLEKVSRIEGVVLGLVGGGSLEKIINQMGPIINKFKYIFAECGAVVYIDSKIVFEKNMLDNCDRDTLNNIIKKAMDNISKMPIIYHGHQIDFRKGLIYISPPGMQATEYERSFFLTHDKKLNLRQKLLEELKKVDKFNKFEISYGGSVGIAVHPIGWNKGQVVEYLSKNLGLDINNQNTYYFGDRTDIDGNDYPIYSHSQIKGFSVKNYKDTIEYLNNIFFQNSV